MKIKYLGIYKIKNLLNGKVYIGQSSDITKRFRGHKNNALIKNSSYPLYSSIRKYGIDNFEFNVIEHVNINDLDKREQYWMDYYKSYNPEFGYNLSPTAGGSTRGYKHSEETRKRNSDAHKGQVPWITGKKHKKESIEKMSESHKLQKRKPHTEETKLKMSISGKGKNKGIIRTKEHKELLSLLYKGKKRSKEIIEKIIKTKSKQDCSHSVETKRKIAEINKKLCEDPEYVKKIVARFKIKKVLVA